MDKELIINELIKYYSDGKKADFAKKLGITPQTISAWLARNTFDIELIFTKCEDIDANWLLTGEGNMLKHSSQDNTPNKDIVAALNATIDAQRITIDAQQKTIVVLEDKVADLEEELGKYTGGNTGSMAG